MSEPNREVIDKIRAILNKASEDANPNEAERDVAIRMANKLLLKHGLSMADLGDAERDEQDAWEHEGYFSTSGDFDDWRATLLFRMAPVYFCKSYVIPLGPRGARRSVLLGRADHVAATKAMFEFIVPQLELEFNVAAAKMTQQHRFARRYAIEAAWQKDPAIDTRMPDEELAKIGQDRYEDILLSEGPDAALRDIMQIIGTESTHYAKKVRSKVAKSQIAPSDTDNMGVWRRSFHDAAATRIGLRLRELFREEVEDIGEVGMALVKNEKADLDRFLDSLSLGLRSSGHARQRDAEGANAGREAANRADLSGHRKFDGGGRKELGA